MPVEVRRHQTNARRISEEAHHGVVQAAAGGRRNVDALASAGLNIYI
jgi:hypothetical protein